MEAQNECFQTGLSLFTVPLLKKMLSTIALCQVAAQKKLQQKKQCYKSATETKYNDLKMSLHIWSRIGKCFLTLNKLNTSWMQYIDLSCCVNKVLLFPTACGNLNLPSNLLCWPVFWNTLFILSSVRTVNDMVSVSCFQLTLMDANYVVDEMLGTASYDISKLEVGQTVLVSFLIGKVSSIYLRNTFTFHRNIFTKSTWCMS